MKYYEMFFNQNQEDPEFAIKGWFPIDVSRLHCPDKLNEYIQKGIIREIIPFDCQRFIEAGELCDKQCEHCKAYYVGREPLTAEDVSKLELLDWLAKKDYLTDDRQKLWLEYIEENPN